MKPAQVGLASRAGGGEADHELNGVCIVLLENALEAEYLTPEQFSFCIRHDRKRAFDKNPILTAQEAPRRRSKRNGRQKNAKTPTLLNNEDEGSPQGYNHGHYATTCFVFPLGARLLEAAALETAAVLQSLDRLA